MDKKEWYVDLDAEQMDKCSVIAQDFLIKIIKETDGVQLKLESMDGGKKILISPHPTEKSALLVTYPDKEVPILDQSHVKGSAEERRSKFKLVK